MEKLLNLKFLLALLAFLLTLGISASCSDGEFSGAVGKTKQQNSNDDDDDDDYGSNDDDDDDDDDSLVTGNPDTLGLLEDLTITNNINDEPEDITTIYVSLDNGPEDSDKEVQVLQPLIPGTSVTIENMCNKHRVSQLLVRVTSRDKSANAKQLYFAKTSFYGAPLGDLEMTFDTNGCDFLGIPAKTACLDKDKDNTFTLSCPNDDGIEVIGF